MIDLYTWPTPNGRKISIALEELGLEYRAHSVDITKGEQRNPKFMTISPNSKIPAIVDTQNNQSLMESGAILLYLAEKCGQLMPKDASRYWEAVEWIMWQMGGPGPILGQIHHFVKFNPGKSLYAEERYLTEGKRLYGVLNKKLQDREFVGEVEGNFDYPVFVKPANLGSSVGISKVRTRDQLIDGLNCAGSYDTKIIVEASVEGAREIECAVLGDEHPEVSGVGEIIPGAEFYDYRTKYFNDCAKLVIPAELPKKTTKQIQDMSLRAFQAINCSGLARVDFFIRPNGEVMLNEINTMPGFTPISMYPKLWEETGLHYPQLIDRLIQLGLERHASRGALKTTLQP